MPWDFRNSLFRVGGWAREKEKSVMVGAGRAVDGNMHDHNIICNGRMENSTFHDFFALNNIRKSGKTVYVKTVWHSRSCFKVFWNTMGMIIPTSQEWICTGHDKFYCRSPCTFPNNKYLKIGGIKRRTYPVFQDEYSTIILVAPQPNPKSSPGRRNYSVMMNEIELFATLGTCPLNGTYVDT